MIDGLDDFAERTWKALKYTGAVLVIVSALTAVAMVVFGCGGEP